MAETFSTTAAIGGNFDPTIVFGIGRNRLKMSRFARHALFASVIAIHAIVSLCGPCLHELPGASHERGAKSKAQCPRDPAQAPRDSSDNCLICQFVAQGQLLVECDTQLLVVAVTEQPVPSLPPSRILHIHVPASPRAPPLNFVS
jgi:hypothetical protein